MVLKAYYYIDNLNTIPQQILLTSDESFQKHLP